MDFSRLINLLGELRSSGWTFDLFQSARIFSFERHHGVRRELTYRELDRPKYRGLCKGSKTE